MEAGLITAQEAQKYLDVNNRLLKTVLLPAYTALGDGLLLLEDETIPVTGLAACPRGKEYYEALLISGSPRRSLRSSGKTRILQSGGLLRPRLLPHGPAGRYLPERHLYQPKQNPHRA